MTLENKITCPLTTGAIVDRVLLFVQELADRKLYTYQALFSRRIVESVLTNDAAQITGLWARQCGKTETVACVVIGLAVLLPILSNEFPDDPRFQPFREGLKTGVYAPIQDQADTTYGRMRDKILSDRAVAVLADVGVSITRNRGDTLAFSNGSIIISRTASPDAQIEGKTHHLVILEEAQKLLRSKVEKEIIPMLASTNGTIVKIGTAWESRGGFHVSIQQNLEEHKNGGKRNHFEFPYTIVISEKRRAYEEDGDVKHLLYEKYVMKELHRLGGEGNDEFKMNFMCLWQETRVIAIREGVFKRAAIGDMEAGAGYHGMLQVAGLDVAKVHDATVLTLMGVDMNRPLVNRTTMPGADEDKQIYYKKTILDWVELSGSFEGNTGQYSQLVRYLLGTSVKILVIDATTMGDPVYERIQALLGDSIDCVPYRFSSLTKSNLYRYYLQEIHAGRVQYAAGPQTRQRIEYRKFQQEHLDLDKQERGGYAVCQAPEGGHDDYPDSAALACWGEKIMGDLIMPEIKVFSSAPGGGGDSRRRDNPSDAGTISTTMNGRGGRYRSRGYSSG